MSKARVFVSHSHADAEVALALATALEARSLKSWIAPRDIPVGAQYNEAIHSAIQETEAFALILSTSALKSAHIEAEVSLALAKGARMFVYAVEPAVENYSELPRGWQYFLAVPQVVRYPGADGAADAVAASLGADPPEKPAQPAEAVSAAASEGDDATPDLKSIAADHSALGSALSGLRAKPEIAEIVGRVVAKTGAHHEFVKAARYLSLRRAAADEVVVYVKASTLSLALTPGRANALIASGIGQQERDQGRRRYVKVGANELADPETMSTVEGAILDMLGYASATHTPVPVRPAPDPPAAAASPAKPQDDSDALRQGSMASRQGSTRDRVFVCHSSRDAELAQRLVVDMEAADVPCWIAPRDERAGEPFPGQLVNAIKECGTFVLLVTDHAAGSQHVLRELEQAAKHNRHILPVVVDGASTGDLAYYLDAVHQIHCTAGEVALRVSEYFEERKVGGDRRSAAGPVRSRPGRVAIDELETSTAGAIPIGLAEDRSQVEFLPSQDRHLMVVSQDSKLTREFISAFAHALLVNRPGATIYCVGASLKLPPGRALVVAGNRASELLDQLVTRAGSGEECFLICASMREMSTKAKYRLKSEDYGHDCHLILGWEVDRLGKYGDCEPCLKVISSRSASLRLEVRTASFRPAAAPDHASASLSLEKRISGPSAAGA